MTCILHDLSWQRRMSTPLLSQYLQAVLFQLFWQPVNMVFSLLRKRGRESIGSITQGL